MLGRCVPEVEGVAGGRVPFTAVADSFLGMHRARVGLLFALVLLGPARHASADTHPPTPIVVSIVGHGVIRLLVADGASRPCDASDNRVLFSDHVAAGSEIKLGSAVGSVCVDHTYGALRESQWAGASIWSGGPPWPGAREPSIHGTVSTDEP